MFICKGHYMTILGNTIATIFNHFEKLSCSVILYRSFFQEQSELMKKIHYLLFYTFILFSTGLLAQYPGSGGLGGLGGFGGGGGGGASLPQGTYEEDTSGVFYYYMDNPEREYTFSDTTLGNYLQHYTPMRDRDWEYSYLGNVGSAHRAMVYQPAYRRGIDMGFHQFDLYGRSKENLPYYNVKKAFSLIEHSQARKEDAYFKAKFGMVFKDGVSFSLDYGKVNQADQYTYNFANQAARNTNLATGIRLKNKKGNYQGFFTYVSNAFDQRESGGLKKNVELFTVIDYQSARDLGGGAKLKEAYSRYEWREVSYRHSLNLVRQSPTLSLPKKKQDPTLSLPKGEGKRSGTVLERDSLHKNSITNISLKEEEKRAYIASHTISYLSSNFKSYDKLPDTTTNFYKDLLTDKRGLRLAMHLNKLENAFTISTTKARATADNRPKAQHDFLEVGLVHSLYWLNQEPEKRQILNNLFLTGRWNFAPSEGLKVETYAHYGLAFSNLADYKLSADLFFDLKKVGQLKVQFINQLYEPTLLQQKAYISTKQVWENTDFKKTFETNLIGTYLLPKYGVELTGGYHLIQNYTYIDSFFHPMQLTTPMSILQLSAKKNFRIGVLGLDNLVVFQKSTNDALNLPAIFGKHSLFLEGKPWKKQNNFGRLGFDVRYTTRYTPDRYMPLIGQFYTQSNVEVAFFPALDAFLNFKISKVLGFVKYENITTLLTK
ncbi:MAG: hypothetical protein RLZZ292_1331, partial [Bacteroidota bacterium]